MSRSRKPAAAAAPVQNTMSINHFLSASLEDAKELADNPLRDPHPIYLISTVAHVHMLSYLDARSIFLGVMLVSKNWRKSTDLDLVWKQAYVNKFSENPIPESLCKSAFFEAGRKMSFEFPIRFLNGKSLTVSVSFFTTVGDLKAQAASYWQRRGMPAATASDFRLISGNKQLADTVRVYPLCDDIISKHTVVHCIIRLSAAAKKPDRRKCRVS